MGSDGDLYRVDVTAGSGSVASYVAFGGNVLLKGDWETDPTPMLDVASLMPFLSTVSKCVNVGTPVYRDAGTSTGCI
jgi:hypothetical protein